MKQVLAEIDREEPNYEAFAKLGASALPHLKLILDAEDPLKSAKAAYAASLVGGAGAVELLRAAADHHDAQVRIAVAQGLGNLAQAAPSDLVIKSLDDADPGVRKLALRTAGLLRRPDFAARVAEIAKDDPAEHLRSAAGLAAKQIKASVPAKKAAPN
jgi:HEAT repeat protein